MSHLDKLEHSACESVAACIIYFFFVKCYLVALHTWKCCTSVLQRCTISFIFFHVGNFFNWCFNRKYLEEPCVWVESNTSTLSILSSQAEIGLGFLLIISLFSSVTPFHFLRFLPTPFFLHFSIPCSFNFVSNFASLDPLIHLIWTCRWQRNIIQTFMYWQVCSFHPLLRMHHNSFRIIIRVNLGTFLRTHWLSDVSHVHWLAIIFV